VESEGSIYFATNQGLVLSRDGGKTVTVRDGTSGLPTRFTYKLEVDGQKLFLATQQGLSVSADRGLTFSTKTTANGLHNNYVGWIFYDRSINRLYALHVTGMSYSDDGGTTFTAKTTFTGAAVNSFDQIFVTDGGRIYLRASDNKIYTSTSVDGTYTAVRTSVTRMFITRSGKIYAASNTGLHFSVDDGQTFVQKQTADGLPSNIVYSLTASEDGSSILVGTDTNFAYSFNGGATFVTGSITAHTGGSDNVGRVFFAESGRAMITDQTTPTLSAYQMRDVARSYSDFDAPTVDKASFVQSSALGSGVSTSWTHAVDETTAKSELIYEMFSGSVGVDFSDLKAVYLNGDLVGRFQGVATAPVLRKLI
jgi:hypothetical protein